MRSFKTSYLLISPNRSNNQRMILDIIKLYLIVYDQTQFIYFILCKLLIRSQEKLKIDDVIGIYIDNSQ